MADEDRVAPVMRQDASSGEVADKSSITSAQKATDSKQPTMAVKVYGPFKIYYEGEANSISGVNQTGPFDILPHHHKFLCMLVPCELVIRTPFDVQRIKITRALMHVKSDQVTVFVDV